MNFSISLTLDVLYSWSRMVFVTTAMLIVASCSSLKVTFSFADFLIANKASDYLDIDQNLKEKINYNSGALTSWLRENMLSKYAAFLRGNATLLDSGSWSDEDLNQTFATLRDLFDETSQGVSPFIASVLIENTAPEKFSYLQNSISEERKEVLSDLNLVSEEEFIGERIHKRVDFISKFTGPLQANQIEIIAAHSQNSYIRHKRWLENRHLRQDAFLEYLKGKPTENELNKFIYTLLMKSHMITDPGYKVISEMRWQNTQSMTYALLKSLNKDQIDELVANLISYADDFKDISETNSSFDP